MFSAESADLPHFLFKTKLPQTGFLKHCVCSFLPYLGLRSICQVGSSTLPLADGMHCLQVLLSRYAQCLVLNLHPNGILTGSSGENYTTK